MERTGSQIPNTSVWTTPCLVRATEPCRLETRDTDCAHAQPFHSPEQMHIMALPSNALTQETNRKNAQGE